MDRASSSLSNPTGTESRESQRKFKMDSTLTFGRVAGLETGG
jgi:hypothetical protein